MAMTHRGSVGHVYVASVTYQDRPAIKVGFTTNVAKRMRQLHGDLIASHPGSFIQEQHLHGECAAFRCQHTWRETYWPDVLPTLMDAWHRMFDMDLAEQGSAA